MARSHYLKVVQDEEGRPIGGASAYIYDEGTTTLISETIYAEDTGTTTLTNPITTDSLGTIEFFLAANKRFDVKVVKGSRVRTFTGTAMGLTTSTLSVQDEGTGLTQRDILNFTGAGVTATDDSANGRTNVTISGGDIATATLWDAKGDLAVGTGADTAVRKAVGPNGAILLGDSGQSDGLRYALVDGEQLIVSETTTSTAYADLATVGPDISVTIGASGKALLILGALLQNNTAAAHSFMGFAVSGTSTVVATDNQCLRYQSDDANSAFQGSYVHLVTGLTPGVNTFTAKYRVSAGTGTFNRRSLYVLPL